jgi:Helix-turn-helix domain
MPTKENRRRLLEETKIPYEPPAPAVTRRRLLDPVETAAILRVRVNTLAQYRMNKKGPPWIRIGARIRYDAEQLEEYINHVSHPTSDHPLTSRV